MVLREISEHTQFTPFKSSVNKCNLVLSTAAVDKLQGLNPHNNMASLIMIKYYFYCQGVDLLFKILVLAN